VVCSPSKGTFTYHPAQRIDDFAVQVLLSATSVSVELVVLEGREILVDVLVDIALCVPQQMAGTFGIRHAAPSAISSHIL